MLLNIILFYFYKKKKYPLFLYVVGHHCANSYNRKRYFQYVAGHINVSFYTESTIFSHLFNLLLDTKIVL